jgi:two-component system cell cycle response regulator DivK
MLTHGMSCAASRRMPKPDHIPIIGMSAYALDSEREKAIASGCDEFDVKPIDFEALVGIIRRLVANPK